MRDSNGPPKSIVGRGAADKPKNRFERIEVEPDPGEEDAGRPETVYLKDHSRSVIARNASPDIGFDASINPYRGCGHGCVYCLLGDTPIYGTVRRGATAGGKVAGHTRRDDRNHDRQATGVDYGSFDAPLGLVAPSRRPGMIRFCKVIARSSGRARLGSSPAESRRSDPRCISSPLEGICT